MSWRAKFYRRMAQAQADEMAKGPEEPKEVKAEAEEKPKKRKYTKKKAAFDEAHSG